MEKKKHSEFFKTFIIITITFILGLFIKGYSFSDFTLNPATKVEKLSGEKEVTKGFSNEEFQIFYVNSEEGIKEYVFSGRFGIWIGYEYPSRKDVSGFTDGKATIYYYGEFASNEMYDYIENAVGEKIYPHKSEIDGVAKCVYQIPYKSSENMSYKFVDNDNKINIETLFLDGEVSLTKYYNGDVGKLKSTVVQLKQEQPELWSLIEKIIESADKNHEIADGRKYRGRQSDVMEWDIDIKYETGDFINIEKRKKSYDWTGTISYGIDIKGEYPNTIGIHIREYTKVSMYESFSGESHAYPVTVPKEINKYFEGL